MSHDVAVSRTIAATPDDLWSVLTDVVRWSALLQHLSNVELLTPGEYAVGTRWRAVRTTFGRAMVQQWEVVDLDPNRRLALTSGINDEITFGLEFHIEASGDHSESRPRTHVTVRMQSDEPADDDIWLKRVLGAIGARNAQETLAEDLADFAAAVERPETRDMLVVHRLFNRELGTAPGLVRAVPAGDLHRTGVVADHLTIVLDALVDHHHGEDVLIWPLLALRVGIHPDLTQRLGFEHSRIHLDIIKARALIVRWREAADPAVRDQLADLLLELGSNLRAHLETEENELLPLIEQHLTRFEYDRLTAHGRESLPREQAAMIVQMFLEGATRSERALILEGYAPVMQLLIRTVGARQYRRHVRRLRAPNR